MKERIVFKTESSIKGRKEIAKINEYVNNFNFDCAFERKVEQVPETWEELKELCKNITIDLKLTKDGKIYCYEHLIAENRTPQQMWQIIKNLIGEE